MKLSRIVAVFFLSVCVAIFSSGCGGKKHAEGDGHDHAEEEAEGKDDEYGRGEESPSHEAQLIELKLIHDYTIKPRLRSTPGLAEVNTSGGYGRSINHKLKGQIQT